MKMTHDFEKSGNVAEKSTLLDHETEVVLKNCVQNSSTLNMTEVGQKLNLEANCQSKSSPIDRYNFVYWIFIIHGIGTLMPWNMFMTAKSYYTDYKLNVVSSDASENELLADYRARFLSIAGVSSQIPNLVFNGLNLLLAYYSNSRGGNLTVRIVSSILINFLLLIFTLTLVLIDTSAWTLTFFYVTVGSIVVLNMSNGFYQNSIYGVAAQLPMKFTNAVILGNNVCGTLVSVMAIVSIAISPDPKLAAFYYFLNALIILGVCLGTYFLLPMSSFYRYYIYEQHVANDQVEIEPLKSDSIEDSKPKENKADIYGLVVRRVALQCINVFVIFLVTLLLFPTIVSDVRPSKRDSFTTLPISSQYFTPITCYLAFNFTAMIGNLLPSLLMFPRAKHLHWAVLARLAFIPFFLLCNYKNHVYPTWFDNDLLYLFGVILLGLSHGHLSSLGMMYASKTVPEHASIAGMMAAFCLVGGIFTGISLSFIF